MRLNNTVLYMKQDNRVFDMPLDLSDFVLECSDVTLVYAGEGKYTDQRGSLGALRDKFGSNCFEIVEGDDGVDFWRQKRTEWFYRHADNAQISFYRSREPSP